MSELNSLFRKRIGISEGFVVTFEKLDEILYKTAMNFPFENLCVIKNKQKEITKENLINKMLVNNEGGLCYELNSILYFFLIENGFNAVLTGGVVYDHAKNGYQKIGRTHAAILLTHEGETYLIDTGFGANIPLKPVPLSGLEVSSSNGEFRIIKKDTVYGDYVLQIKLKHKDIDWKEGYAFVFNDNKFEVSELNDIQKIISEHEESPFNKSPLITRLTNEGNLTLTNSSFTKWINGIVTKEEIDDVRFKELANQFFGLNNY